MKRFSLMELLVVMGIMLLMMSLLLPTVGPMISRAELDKIVSTISSQLEVGYLKSLEKKQSTRVSFEYDPKGKNLTNADVLKVSGAASAGSEIDDRQNQKFDINNDGVAGGNVNRQFFWIKVYLCPGELNGSPKNNGTQNPDGHKTTPLVKDITVSAADGTFAFKGPYWIKRPISRVFANGSFRPTKLYLKPIWDIATEQLYYYRPVMNKGLDVGLTEELMPIGADGTCDLLKDSNGGTKLNPYDTETEIKAYTGALTTTYKNSVAIYKNKGSDVRYRFMYGKDIDDFYKAKPLPKDQLYEITTEWYDILEGDFVDPSNLDFGTNDDEDKLIDEGMSVSVESYNQSTDVPALSLEFSKGVLYNNYFNGLQDHNNKLGREYFIGGKDRKGVMLRKIWGVKPNKPNSDLVLLWSFNKVETQSSGDFVLLGVVSPYYFSVVFDQNSGSGMFFCTTNGIAHVGKLYFQVSDDDNKLTRLIEFSDGSARSGTLAELGFPTTKAKLEALGYYQGVELK